MFGHLKPFVWWRSRRRCHRVLRKVPNIAYLQRNGDLLTCLFRPSHGDSPTVIRNYVVFQGSFWLSLSLSPLGKWSCRCIYIPKHQIYLWWRLWWNVRYYSSTIRLSITDFHGTTKVGMETEEEVRRRNKLSHHEQYPSSSVQRHYPRNRSSTRANAKIHHNTKQELIEYK